MNPTDTLFTVVAATGNSNQYTRNVDEDETIEQFENRVQRFATMASAVEGSDVFIMRAAQVLRIPVQIEDLA